jgi:hypothetical protein
MKQVQRPEIDGASGEISTARRMGNDGGLKGRRRPSGHAKVVSRATANPKK